MATTEYLTDEPYREYGDGYSKLTGDWLTYYNVATKFAHKARYEDRDDLLHSIMLNLAIADGNTRHKPDNPSWLYRIASFTVAQYWRDYYYRTNGIDCGHCSNTQRKKCRDTDLYPNYCPKAVEVASLSQEITDDEGNTMELWETIADDKAIDLDAWIDDKTWLGGCPQRLVAIATKKAQGKPLNHKEQVYLCYQRKKELKKRQQVLIF